MLYYLSEYFSDSYSILNVLGYNTVRAGGAMFTGFMLSILLGPRVIQFLRDFKIGQVIKEDHVKDLHELHKAKGGTPTMGGVLIIVTTLISLLLWSNLTNPLLLIATAVLVLMGVVGFMDDFIKLRRKHNDGLSARAKFSGQLLVGLLLGAVLVTNPITYGASYLSHADVNNWRDFVSELQDAHDKPESQLGRFVQTFSPELVTLIKNEPNDSNTRNAIRKSLNKALENPEVYIASAWSDMGTNDEASKMLAAEVGSFKKGDIVRLNRLLLESSVPELIRPSIKDLHTKVSVPGFKDLLIPMGILYIPFVLIIIVGTSNAVNLTDGLDGLATGASVIAIGAFTALAYVVSRADWSSYLFVTYIPEASELAVFGAALLGTGLGFLWFNAHPAEVFMGDTGSLALGGVLGTMAILTKQELLLPIVGGLFVIEALSVILQVGSFKLRKKRIFRMAPLHHHFELKGWSEIKVTIRFWIVAAMFALMSLATLKLR